MSVSQLAGTFISMDVAWFIYYWCSYIVYENLDSSIIALILQLSKTIIFVSFNTQN